jgi:hypothetical protein
MATTTRRATTNRVEPVGRGSSPQEGRRSRAEGTFKLCLRTVSRAISIWASSSRPSARSWVSSSPRGRLVIRHRTSLSTASTSRSSAGTISRSPGVPGAGRLVLGQVEVTARHHVAVAERRRPPNTQCCGRARHPPPTVRADATPSSPDARVRPAAADRRWCTTLATIQGRGRNALWPKAVQEAVRTRTPPGCVVGEPRHRSRPARPRRCSGTRARHRRRRRRASLDRSAR